MPPLPSRRRQGFGASSQVLQICLEKQEGLFAAGRRRREAPESFATRIRPGRFI